MRSPDMGIVNLGSFVKNKGTFPENKGRNERKSAGFSARLPERHRSIEALRHFIGHRSCAEREPSFAFVFFQHGVGAKDETLGMACAFL